MEELKDIQGLDHISSWPLAIGWWLVAAFVVLLIIFAGRLIYSYYKYRSSWQYQAYKNLLAIETELALQTVLEPQKLKASIDQFAIQLKNIAISTAPRERCAGLIGKQWLAWLHANDPHAYDWSTNGSLLIGAQYMRTIRSDAIQELKNLIAAAKAWVQAC